MTLHHRIIQVMIDCHFHTNRSYCADEDMTLELAVGTIETSDGLDGIVITDHTFSIYFPLEVAWSWSYMSDPSVFDAHREFGNERMETYLEDVAAFQKRGLLTGLETELMPDGRFTFDPEYRSSLDLLIGSVHFLPFPDNVSDSEALDIWRRNTSGLINGGIDVLGHPFRFISNMITVTKEMVRDVVREAAAVGVALELNSHCEVPDADILMLREIAEIGAKLALSTDAHRSDEAGVFSYHERVMGMAGLSLSDFDVFVPGGIVPKNKR
ncbi:MAG: hypothetical protein KAG97_02530 [Victivallales bacterium]|nr:hypothetical protein [Victivallales bacterium]